MRLIVVYSMNINTIFRLVNKCSFDDGKNETLKTIAGQSAVLTLDDLTNLLSCYSFDDGKIEALRILNNYQKISGNGSIAFIMDIFSFDSGRVKALEILSNQTLNITSKSFAEILRSMSFDDNRKQAYNILKNQNIIVNSLSEFAPILRCFSYDAARLSIFKLFTINNVDCNNISIILNCFSHSSNKMEVLKILTEKLDKVTGEELIILLGGVSESNMLEVYEYVKDKLSVNPSDNFCKELGEVIGNPDNYKKICKYIGCSASVMEQYVPKLGDLNLNGTIISGDTLAEMDSGTIMYHDGVTITKNYSGSIDLQSGGSKITGLQLNSKGATITLRNGRSCVRGVTADSIVSSSF